jgi:hypothetical protein
MAQNVELDGNAKGGSSLSFGHCLWHFHAKWYPAWRRNQVYQKLGMIPLNFFLFVIALLQSAQDT